MTNLSFSVDSSLSITVSFAISIFVIVLNAIEIVLIVRMKSQKKPHELTLLSLSLTDLFFGFLHCVKFVLSISHSVLIESVFELLDTFKLFFVSCSILHLTWITIDRYLAVEKPFKHQLFITRKKTIFVLVFTWLITLIISVSIYIADEVIEENSTEVESHITRDFVPLFVAGFILFADVFFIIVYGIIVSKHKSQSSNIPNNNNSKIAYICLLTVLAFILLATPNAIGSIVCPVSAKKWTDVLLLLNSAINSIIYFFRLKIGRAVIEGKRNKISPLPLEGVLSTGSLSNPTIEIISSR